MTVAGGLIDWEETGSAAEGKPLTVRDVNVIRVRDRDGGPIDTYLEIVSDGDLKATPGRCSRSKWRPSGERTGVAGWSRR